MIGEGEDSGVRARACTVRLFEDQASSEADQRTIHIFGVNRGGTTAVAGLVQRLGVYLGSETGTNLEDRDFRIKRGLPAILETVRERNELFDVWGWKHPHSNGYIEEALPHLRNPRFIAVTRDLTANAIGMYARGDESLPKALRFPLKQTRRNLSFINDKKRPTLMVSYEKLLVHTRQTAAEIADFCGAEMTEERMQDIVEFVTPGRYQTGSG